MSRKTPKKLLMVCVGNICRSPIAEAVMRDSIDKFGLQDDLCVDSAGIEGWHAGSRADERALSVLSNHQIEYDSRARIINLEDFYNFDYIFGMDQSNIASLKSIAPIGSTAKILLLGDFGLKPDERIIEDPYYYVGNASFEKVYRQCTIACPNILMMMMTGINQIN